MRQCCSVEYDRVQSLVPLRDGWNSWSQSSATPWCVCEFGSLSTSIRQPLGTASNPVLLVPCLLGALPISEDFVVSILSHIVRLRQSSEVCL